MAKKLFETPVLWVIMELQIEKKLFETPIFIFYLAHLIGLYY